MDLQVVGYLYAQNRMVASSMRSREAEDKVVPDMNDKFALLCSIREKRENEHFFCSMPRCRFRFTVSGNSAKPNKKIIDVVVFVHS